jgi:hypothetical protein
MAYHNKNVQQKYRDIQDSFRSRYGLGLRRQAIITQLAKEYYLSEARIEKILQMNIDPEPQT